MKIFIFRFVRRPDEENVPMLSVFERSGLAMSTERDGTLMHVTLSLAYWPRSKRPHHQRGATKVLWMAVG
jgi:hypothetical protein